MEHQVFPIPFTKKKILQDHHLYEPDLHHLPQQGRLHRMRLI
jgi:hypothetical protein